MECIAMAVRITLVFVSAFVALESFASAQLVLSRNLEAAASSNRGSRSGCFACSMGVSLPAVTNSDVPRLQDVATQSYRLPLSRYQSCEAHRSGAEQWASRSSRSADAVVRRYAPRKPAKEWTQEELAASKFQAAHSLWRAGNSVAARRWLEVVVQNYAATPTAERARLVLAKL
jgi:hypothetical protein